VTRLYPHKRIDLLFDVFQELPEERLLIIGGYMKGDHSQRYVNEIIGDKPTNVTIIREVDEKRLAMHYGNCKAFITLSKDEDFGMTILEANSAGKAVVATNEGGHKETVINNKTGYLVQAEKKDIISAIKIISKDPKKFKLACQEHAVKYNTKRFIEKIRKELGN
jgi:glycosyltransferase involved in cell wall biosynthesis